MSEETPPAKKAARKSVRKKSASKRVSRKSAKSESSDEQLPRDEARAKPAPESPSPEAEAAPAKAPREPKSGVRDARRETADEPLPNEVSEKLVDSTNSPNDEKRQRAGDNKQKDQNRSDQNEGRGRGRNRGRNRGQERGSDRPEKREPKPRISVDGKKMAKKAWKIFESEVTEEGLALLDDNSLRDYARSSFNAARLFLEEEGRVTGRKEKPKKSKKEKEKDQKKDQDND